MYRQVILHLRYISTPVRYLRDHYSRSRDPPYATSHFTQ
jgi:hypothetical protein